MNQEKILVVEDEWVVMLEIVDRLKGLGYQVVDTADTGHEAVEKARSLDPDLILMDIILQGDMDGINTGKKILASMDIPIVFLTAHSDEATLKRAQAIAPFGYLVKPFEERELRTTIEIALFRHKMEKKVRQSEEWLKTTIRSIGDAVIATDEQGIVEFLNPVAEAITGWSSEEALGQPFHKVFNIIHETTRNIQENPVEKVLTTGNTVRLANHTVLICKNGQEMPIEDSAAPIHDARGRLTGVVVVFYDVTERNKREADLLRTQKLESLGVMAGGIAHDFNNLLTAIMGNVSLLKNRIDPSDETEAIFGETEEALGMAKKLTQQLLVFSKGGTPLLKVLDVKKSITSTASFALCGLDVGFSLNADHVWSIKFDEGQFAQMIHNLVLNAAQSMPGGGLVNIECENVQIEKNSDSLKPGIYVRIRITDQGVGIDPDVVNKIFDPYFSTKPGGSGLGLTTVYTIVKNHEARIHVDSQPGIGTSFELLIPAVNVKPVQKNENKSEELPKTGSRVLLMDDEVHIRKFAVRALTSIGYTIEVTLDGRETIERYKHAKENNNPFSLVILDLTIPGGMGGKETIESLKKIDPGVCAIVSSGYSEDPVMSDYKNHGFCGMLPKPYTIDDLFQCVKDALD